MKITRLSRTLRGILLIILTLATAACKNPNSNTGIPKKLYITDSENDRIIRIDDMSGTGWVEYGTEGTGIGFFNSPISVVLH